MEIDKVIPKMRHNVSLKEYTSFRIGGNAKYFLEAKSEEDLTKGIEAAIKLEIPFFVLGGGSNVLISDDDYKGMIIKIAIDRIQKKDESGEKVLVTVGAGTPLNKLVSFCLDSGLGGFEWAAGIPGTVGGAIRGNAGAFGKTVKDNLISVSFFSIPELKIGKCLSADCHLGYRESIFKKNSNLLILGAEFNFERKAKDSSEKEIKDYLKKRKEKHPKGFSAGSIFKNYAIKNAEDKQKIIKKYPKVQEVMHNEMIPAGFLLEVCGLKGKRKGDAKISEDHANFIINVGEATFNDVDDLIIFAKKEVNKKFGIELEEEIQRIVF